MTTKSSRLPVAPCAPVQLSSSSLRLRREVLMLLRPARLALLSSLMLAGLTQNVSANPQGGVVVAGEATIVTGAPNRVDIVQGSDRAIIDWQGFSIDAGEVTHFQQPSASSVALNRVKGTDASLIAGALSANGTVMLVNPNGIVIGPTGTVDVAGLVATTANIRDDDFLAQRLSFNEASPNQHASVVNEGRITIGSQGLAALVAPHVRNSGVIEARLGSVALGGARTFSLDFHGDGLLSFSPGSAVEIAPTAASALVTNSGQIIATGGTVQLSASAVKGVVDSVINTSGLIEARSVAERDGKIILSGGAHGAMTVGGTVDVSSETAQGGSVHLNGETIRVAATALIDASGAQGGGSVDIGHEAGTPLAKAVQIDRGSLITADATLAGDGGDIVVWSTDSTNFAGVISARGGGDGGDGGFVEISSRDVIGLSGSVDLEAPLGATGDLLIDPATLTIIDAAAGVAELDPAASDGTITAGDGNTPNNTISRGTLEALSGSANITLEATGLITVNAMVGGRIDLQTNSSRTFTLRSTTTAGIRFMDANTAIHTQGGNITLEALKAGELTNIGGLMSSGGHITLVAGGLVQLANTLDAGLGNVSVSSLSNSIQNLGTARAIGRNVTWSAAYGSLGTSLAPLDTSTRNLMLATGGNLFVVNDTMLSQLELRTVHTVDTPFVYQLTAPQLTFDVTDTGTDYLVNSIVSESDLSLTFAGDRNIVVGDVNAMAGLVSLSTSAGFMADDGDAATGITGTDLVLSAMGGIGAVDAPLLTSVSTLRATAGTGGGVVVDNTAALDVLSLTAPGGTSRIQAAGNLTMRSVAAAGSTLSLASTGGSVASAGGPDVTLDADVLSLSAATTIGSSVTPLTTSATTLNAAAGTDIYVTTSGAAVLGSVMSAAGPISITTHGDMSVERVDATSAGVVTLTATNGSITAASEGPNVIADTFDFNSTLQFGDVALGVVANTIRGAAGTGGINLTQTGTTTLETLATTGGLHVASTAGDITLGALQADSVTISAAAGSLFDDGNASTAVVAGSVNLAAMAGTLGTSALDLETQTASLTLGSGSDIYVDSTRALTTLDITNTHATPGTVNTLIVTAPYLEFDVTDTGSQFLLTNITGVTLSALSFTGDQTSELVKLYATGSLSVRATQGDLRNDSGPNSAATRLSGASISLTADAGNLGTAAPGGALETNTSVLSATTGGNLYINDITDLSQLTIRSTHVDPVQDHQFILTAPGLVFDVTDSAAGYALTRVNDATSLRFDFTGDRTITAGTIDTSRSGWVTLRSTAGAVLDDGVKTTQILGDTVSLNSHAGDVGVASGTGYMDVIARQLQGSAAGSFDVALPYSANTAASNAAVTLNGIYAGGPVTITLDNGDLRIDSLTSGAAASLTATNGSILSSGSLSATGLTLSASGAIGAATSILQTNVDGGVSANAGGGGLYLNNEGAIDLLTASATGPLAISGTQNIVVGAIDAGVNAAALSASGSLIDDGDAATRIVGSAVSLSADSGTLGAAEGVLSVTAPELTLVSGGDVYVEDSVALTALSVSGTASSASRTKAYSVTAPGLTLEATDDASTITLVRLTNSGTLNFGFSTQRSLRVGAVNTSGGAAALASVSGSILDDGDAGTMINAPTLTLRAGNSLGASGTGNALATDAMSLNLTALRDFYVSSAASLSSLAVRSDAFAGTANNFGITAAGQTFTLSDNGSTHYLQTVTGGLGDFSFSGRKHLNLGTISASGAVALETSIGASSVTMDGVGGSRVSGSSVAINTIGSSGGHIGTSGTRIAVGTPSLALSSPGNIYVSNNQALSALAVRQTHPNNTTHFNTEISASGLTFALADAPTTVLSNISSSGMSFTYDSDRPLQVGTLNMGGAGAVTLIGRAINSTSQAIADDANDGTRITAGTVNLNPGSNQGYIGAAGSGNLEVTTANLIVRSTGDIYIANSSSLNSLAVTASHSSSGNRTYAISAPGLTFSVADQSLLVTGGQGTVINNVSNSGLNFSFTTDRTLQIVNLNTGSGGSVTLGSNSIVDDNNDATRITAGTLTLNGGSAGESRFSQRKELDTTVGTLHTNLSQQLELIETDDLTLGTNSVGAAATLTSLNGGFLSDGTADFSTFSLTLTAANASLGTVMAPLLLDARTLTLHSGGDIHVDSVVDLVALNVTNTHAAGGVNTLHISAPNLTFDIVDNDGSRFDAFEVTDRTGIDFTFTGDAEIRLGLLDVLGGNALAVTSTGGDIFNDGNAATQLTGAAISLAAGGSVGRADPIIVNTSNLQLATGGNLNVTDNLDLTLLGVNLRDQPGGATYMLDVPNLTFDISDDGTTTTVNDVTDTSGIGFSLQTVHSQDVQVIDTQRYGSVWLYSAGDITGSGADTGADARRITAASASFEATGGGGIGLAGDPLKLSVPLLTLRSTGNIDINSDTHIDRLNIDNRHGSSGTYAIVSPDLTFNVMDMAGTVSILDITDTTGLNLNYSADQDFRIGTINLGTAGNLNLSGTTGGIDFAGDGDANTLITAVGVDIYTLSGAIGTPGGGNELNIHAHSFSGNAGGGGARLDFRGPVSIGSVTSNGPSEIINAGDIALGNYDANGQTLTVTAGGSILSGNITDTSTLNLVANGGGIGTVSAIQTNSNSGTTILNATAANGGVALAETDALTVNTLSADGPVTLGSRFELSVGQLDASSGAVTLTTSEGSITGASGNLISGAAVTLNASYSQGAPSIGTSGTRLNTSTPELTLNARGALYVGSNQDLDSLTIQRSASSNGAPGGALSITAPNLAFSASDTGTMLTLTNVTDSTGLDFSLTSYSALTVDTLNVGVNSAVFLSSARTASNPANAIPSIVSTGGGLITARNLTLATSGGAGAGFIGTSATPLRTSVSALAANSQNGGIYVRQSGALTVDQVFSGGALSVVTTAGDLTVGNISYGNNEALTLTAAGRLLDDAVSTTSLQGVGTGDINLTAATGIGTALAPFAINDLSLNNINATVTGAGSAYLDVTSFANPRVNVTAANGSINLITAGTVTLANLISATDAVGNGIFATTRAGNLTLGNVSAGARYGTLDLRAPTGAITALNGSNSISAFEPYLSAASGIGTFSAPLNVTGQNIVADTLSGNVYLAPTGIAVLGFVRSQGGAVSVTGTSDIVAANVLSTNGGVTLATSGADATIYAGNINAGSGYVTLSATNGQIVDDGVLATAIVGGSGTFTARDEIGTNLVPLQTQLASLSGAVSDNGGFYIDQTGELTLASLFSGGGPLRIIGSDTLSGNATINASGGPITLTSTHGDVLLTGSMSTMGVDATRAVVTVSGGAIAVGTVTSTGAQQYDAPTTLSGHLMGGSLLIDGDLTIAGDGRTLAANSAEGAITINGAIDGAGFGVTLIAPGGTIDIAGDATNLASLFAISDQTTLFNVSTTGAQSYSGSTAFGGTSYITTGGAFSAAGPAVFGADTIISTVSGPVIFGSTLDSAHDLTIDAGTGSATFAGTIGATTALNALVVNSGGLTSFASQVQAASITTDAAGTLVIQPASMTTSGAQSYGESLTLSTDMTFTGTSVTFGGAVNGTTSGQQSLNVVGDASFNGGAGGAVSLQSITVSGAAGVRDTMATAGAQSYGGAISLLSDTSFSLGNGIAFDSTIDGPYSMTVNALAGDITFNEAIGGLASLGDITVNGPSVTRINGSITAASFTTDAPGSTVLDGGAITTSGAQTYGDAVIAGTDTTLTGTNIAVLSSLDAATTGAQAVAIIGDASFDAAVGATAALRALSVSGAGRINGGAVTTTADQAYGSWILGADTLFTGATISSGGAEGASAGQQSLAIAGNAILNGTFGGARALERIVIDGDAQLGGSVTTAATQAYNGAVTLQDDTVLASGGDVTFASSIDGGPSAVLAGTGAAKPTQNGGQALTVNAMTGDVAFNGAVGSVSRVGDVRVNTAGATLFNAPVYAASLTTDVPGTVALNGGVFDTLGAQSYGEIVILGADTTFSGTTVGFTQALESDGGTPRAVAIDADAVFSGAVGHASPLQSLAVSGTSAIDGGAVTTLGSQSYAGASTIGSNTQLTSGGSVAFGATLDAVDLASLQIDAPAGSIRVGGAIGNSGPLGELLVHPGQDATFDGAVTVNELNAIAGAGTMQFNGPLTVLQGVNIENAHGGLVAFGGGAPIEAGTGFVVHGGGRTQLASDVSVSEGPISFDGPLTLTGPNIAMRTEGDISLYGISGPSTTLSLWAGTGGIVGGSANGTPEARLVLRDLVMYTASSAQLYGSLSNIGGAGTAKFVKGPLFGPPFFFNDVPFGPLEFVDQLVIQTARQDANAASHLGVRADSQSSHYPEPSPLEILRAPAWPEVWAVQPATYRCDENRKCEVRITGE